MYTLFQVFYYADIRDMFNMKLFVDTDADTRLARRGAYVTTLSYNASAVKIYKATSGLVRFEMKKFVYLH
jgi:uridine kinase